MIRKYLKAISDNSPESIVLIGKNHEVLICNKTIQNVLFQYFGKVMQEGDFYYPDFVIDSNQELYLEAFETAINGKPFCVQNYTKNDGASYWFEYKMSPIYDDENTLLGVCLSAKNITTEKEAELKISDLSEKLKAILNNTDESIILLDLNHKILTLNTAATMAINRIHPDSKELVGRDFREIIDEDKYKVFYEYYKTAIKGESVVAEIPYQDVNGKNFWLLTKFYPVHKENHELIGVSVFAHNITEKKILEISLKESNARFKKISAIAPVGIIITDSSFKINYANLAIKRMLLYKNDEITALNIADIISDLSLNGHNKIRVNNVDIKTPIFNQAQFVATTRNRTKLDILVSSNSFFIQGKVSYLFVIQDITDIRKKDDIIVEQNNKLKSIAWYQSHIIRSPLARIMGIITFLENTELSKDIDKEEKDFFYQAILDSSHELDNVISNIIGNT